MFPHEHCSAYVNGNDAQYGIKIAHCHVLIRAVIGLQWCLCIVFGLEEKVGPKRKPTTTVQWWRTPFRYDNIEKLLCEGFSAQHLLPLCYISVCNRIDEISIYHDHSNSPCDIPNSLHPALQHKHVKLSAAYFIRKICQISFEMEHRYTAAAQITSSWPTMTQS